MIKELVFKKNDKRTEWPGGARMGGEKESERKEVPCVGCWYGDIEVDGCRKTSIGLEIFDDGARIFILKVEFEV
jgi:hypothetical protein